MKNGFLVLTMLWGIGVFTQTQDTSLARNGFFFVPDPGPFYLDGYIKTETGRLAMNPQDFYRLRLATRRRPTLRLSRMQWKKTPNAPKTSFLIQPKWIKNYPPVFNLLDILKMDKK